MCLQILMITPIRIHNSIFIGKVFQIEVQMGRFTVVGVEKMYTCIQLGVYVGQVFRGLMQKDHSNKCTK